MGEVLPGYVMGVRSVGRGSGGVGVFGTACVGGECEVEEGLGARMCVWKEEAACEYWCWLGVDAM